MLSAGGNAFDAIVAGGFAASLAEAGLTSLGGGGYCLARTAQGHATLFDFFVDMPGRGRRSQEPPRMDAVTLRFGEADQHFHIGLGSCAVPGVLRGLVHLHERLGRLPLAEVLAPTVTLAREGFTLDRFQAYTLGILEGINASTERCAELFAPGGKALQAGERLVSRDLADFLEVLAVEGDRCFYEGEVAQALAAEMEAGGGLITAADLAAYRVIEREPLSIDYRGRTLLTNTEPSLGGPLIGESLRLLSQAPLAAGGHGTPEHLVRMVQVQQQVDTLRARATSKGTTHLSVTDAEGAAAAMSLSNGEGSGSIVPGTGIMLSNMLGEDDLVPEGFGERPPGERVASMMAPSILLEDGRPRLVFGTGGSKRIRMALVHVLSEVVDFGLAVDAAVERPRIFWDGETVQLEPGYDAATVAALAERWNVFEWAAPHLYFGGVHAIDPEWGGWGDSRRDGCALSV